MAEAIADKPTIEGLTPRVPSRGSRFERYVRVAHRVGDAATRAGIGLAYAGMAALMHAIVAVYFRRARAVDCGRFPRRGAALVVANHPSTWTDVVVMDALLGRKLHFLASEELFRPWLRGVLLHLYGALPLAQGGDDADRASRNAVTFRRCTELFDRGEVVAVFPEGVSHADRALLPLKRGTARLALFYAARPHGHRSFAVVPVGLHYSDRTAFRGDVELNVGESVNVPEPSDGTPAGAEAAAAALTERLARALGELVLDVTDQEHLALMKTLGNIAMNGRRTLNLSRSRALARALAALEAGPGSEYVQLKRHIDAYERARRAVRLSDRAVVERHTGVLVTVVLGCAAFLGAASGLVGAVFHGPPAGLIHLVSSRYRKDPPSVAFARIGAGLVLMPAWYGVLAWVSAQWFALRPGDVLGILFAGALLGVMALCLLPWAISEIERWRVAGIAHRWPKILQRVRAERILLTLWIDVLDARAARDHGSVSVHEHAPRVRAQDVPAQQPKGPR